jgi:hypothetical protein
MPVSTRKRDMGGQLDPSWPSVDLDGAGAQVDARMVVPIS